MSGRTDSHFSQISQPTQIRNQPSQIRYHFTQIARVSGRSGARGQPPPPRTAGNAKDERPHWIEKLLKDTKPLISFNVGERKLKNEDIIGLDVSFWAGG